MRTFFNYFLGKIDTTLLRFHYLRIGSAKPLLDELVESTKDNQIEWASQEIDHLSDFHFSGSYSEFSGSVLNLHIDDEDIASIRRDFWENFIWKTEKMPIPVAIVIPSSSNYGSMTLAEVYEGLSLIRLTDRPFKLFEYKEAIAIEVSKWLTDLAAIVHRNEKDEDAVD